MSDLNTNFVIGSIKIGTVEGASVINLGNNFPSQFKSLKKHNQGFGSIGGDNNTISEGRTVLNDPDTMDMVELAENEDVPDWIKEMIKNQFKFEFDEGKEEQKNSDSSEETQDESQEESSQIEFEFQEETSQVKSDSVEEKNQDKTNNIYEYNDEVRDVNEYGDITHKKELKNELDEVDNIDAEIEEEEEEMNRDSKNDGGEEV